MKIYLVGGAVRDHLLGLPMREKDWVVVGARVEDMLNLGYTQVGKSFPVFLHPQSKEEYALARTEKKQGVGYYGFEINAAPHVTLEEDLSRRDLTINAIAQDKAGQFIDPFGGVQDIQHKILRHVSPAFIEDPVRVLRVARFAARFMPMGFSVADETLELMKQMVTAGECDHLIPERVWKEMVRALGEKSPVSFIKVLRACGALKVVLPEIDALYGVEQNVKHHPEVDCGIHIELVLEQATLLSPLPQVRFAALMHDVGKALTPKAELPHHKEHEEKGVAVVKDLSKRLNLPTDFADLARITVQFHGYCHRSLTLSAEEILDLLERSDAFRKPERFEQFLLACKADSRGRPGYENEEYKQADYLKAVLQKLLQLDLSGIIKQNQGNGELIKQAIREARLAQILEKKPQI